MVGRSACRSSETTQPKPRCRRERRCCRGLATGGRLAGAAAGRICQDRQPIPARGSRRLPAFEGIRAKASALKSTRRARIRLLTRLSRLTDAHRPSPRARRNALTWIFRLASSTYVASQARAISSSLATTSPARSTKAVGIVEGAAAQPHWLVALKQQPLCTLVGAVALLDESRGRSNYLAAIRALLDLVAIEPGETVKKVGDGSGVVLREIARRTAGANAILDIDINPYLLREAAALATGKAWRSGSSFAKAVPRHCP